LVFSAAVCSGIPVDFQLFFRAAEHCARQARLAISLALLRIATLRLLTNKVVEARAAELVSVRRPRLPNRTHCDFQKNPPKISSLAVISLIFSNPMYVQLIDFISISVGIVSVASH
jgi:hypothetical protein